jgi:hypothetical protein
VLVDASNEVEGAWLKSISVLALACVAVAVDVLDADACALALGLCACGAGPFDTARGRCVEGVMNRSDAAATSTGLVAESERDMTKQEEEQWLNCGPNLARLNIRTRAIEMRSRVSTCAIALTDRVRKTVVK